MDGLSILEITESFPVTKVQILGNGDLKLPNKNTHSHENQMRQTIH